MNFRKLLIGKKTESLLLDQLQHTMTFDQSGGSMHDYLYGVYEQAYVEGQDSNFLATGRTGFGKSNFGAIIQGGSQPILREITGRNQRFNFGTDAFWSGFDFLYGMRPIVLAVTKKLTGLKEDEIIESVGKKTFFSDVLDTLTPEMIESKYSTLKKLEKKYGYRSKWLDEAQDLNSADSMTLFNKELVKIMSGVREMHQLNTICVPNPWLLNNYVREERVNTVFMIFPMRDRKTTRSKRVVAVYDLSRYFRLLMADSRYVRRLMISPLRLIDKFKPAAISNNVPMFPEESKEWKVYKIMKMIATSRLPLQSIKKLEDRQSKPKKKKKDEFKLAMEQLGYV